MYMVMGGATISIYKAVLSTLAIFVHNSISVMRWAIDKFNFPSLSRHAAALQPEIFFQEVSLTSVVFSEAYCFLQEWLLP